MSSSCRLLLRRSLKLSPEGRSVAFVSLFSLGWRFTLESRCARLGGAFEFVLDSFSDDLFTGALVCSGLFCGLVLSFLLVLSSACSSKIE